LQKELHLTMLFISHDLRVLYQLCDDILILKEGRVVEGGQTKTLYRTPQEPYTIQLLESAGIRGVNRNDKP
ncbi:MAG: ABC transporter ATP-binding protein, partial [Lachnospiraceae bacterium]|nr:ABC transporter ATP-binding protein [Lachnospiraceae bacterium]